MIGTGVDVGGSDIADDIDGDIEDEKVGVILNTNEVDSNRDFDKVGGTGVADVEDVDKDSSGTVCVKVNGVFDTVPETDDVLCLVEGCILVSDIKVDVNSDFCLVADGIPDDSSMCDVEEAEVDESERLSDRDDAFVDTFIDTDGSGCVVEWCISVSDIRLDVKTDVGITTEVLNDGNTLFDSSITPEVISTDSGNVDNIIGVFSKVLTLEPGTDTDGVICSVDICNLVSDAEIEVKSDFSPVADNVDSVDRGIFEEEIGKYSEIFKLDNVSDVERARSFVVSLAVADMAVEDKCMFELCCFEDKADGVHTVVTVFNDGTSVTEADVNANKELDILGDSSICNVVEADVDESGRPCDSDNVTVDTVIDTDGSDCVVAERISVSDIIVDVNSDVDVIADVLIDGNTLSDNSLTPEVGSTDSGNVDNKLEVATKVLKLESVADTVGSIDLVINSVTFGDLLDKGNNFCVVVDSIAFVNDGTSVRVADVGFNEDFDSVYDSNACDVIETDTYTVGRICVGVGCSSGPDRVVDPISDVDVTPGELKDDKSPETSSVVLGEIDSVAGTGVNEESVVVDTADFELDNITNVDEVV